MMLLLNILYFVDGNNVFKRKMFIVLCFVAVKVEELLRKRIELKNIMIRVIVVVACIYCRHRNHLLHDFDFYHRDLYIGWIYLNYSVRRRSIHRLYLFFFYFIIVHKFIPTVSYPDIVNSKLCRCVYNSTLENLYRHKLSHCLSLVASTSE